jgi:hypothetical protein
LKLKIDKRRKTGKSHSTTLRHLIKMFTRSQLTPLNVTDLKQMCRDLGMTLGTGRKADLIDRLLLPESERPLKKVSKAASVSTTRSKATKATKEAAKEATKPEDILTFFTPSTRAENDATNKKRERVISLLSNIPAEFLESEDVGRYWLLLQDSWDQTLATVAESTKIPPYASTKITMRGGRSYHYDADVTFCDSDGTELATRKIEFKYGARTIKAIPQYLSLQAKFEMFGSSSTTYDKFWYERYLDAYRACDPGLTEEKPALDEYLKLVTATSATHPFFKQMKERKTANQKAKDTVVNDSITAYLTEFGCSLDLATISSKVRTSQSEKIFLLWADGEFHIDQITEPEMTDLRIKGIRNGNLLELEAAGTTHSLLLRWRNGGKGILNPAWQISMKRS